MTLNRQFLIDTFQIIEFDFEVGILNCDISIHDQLLTWLKLNCSCKPGHWNLLKCHSESDYQKGQHWVFLCDDHLRLVNNIWNIN